MVPASGINALPFLVHAGKFRRHVIFVVLGQHFLGDEFAALVQLAIGDDALAFTKQVRQDTGIAHRDLLFVIRQIELHGQSIAGATDAAVNDHTAHAKQLVRRRLSGHYFGGGKKEHDIFVQRLERQANANANAGDHQKN
jgi:hypothetical protein